MKSKGRSVLLLMDHAGCHPEHFKEKYSNIKILFLPPNTTSTLQPLDLGIIQNFKVHYCHFLLRFVLAKIEECTTASDVVESVDLLMAIRRVACAWKTVSSDTISKCFQKAGILDSEMDVVDRGMSEEVDPFEDLDADSPLQISFLEQCLLTTDALSKSTSMVRILYLCALTLAMIHGTKPSWKILGNHYKSVTKKRVKTMKAKKLHLPN